MDTRSVNLNPFNIRFTQDTISDDFGRNTRESLEETFRDILYDDTSVEDIDPIVVAKINGKYRVLSGNRRLYIYQKLKELNVIHTVPVEVEQNVDIDKFYRKNTSTNNGLSVEVRQDRHRAYGDKLDDRLERIYDEWKEESDEEEDSESEDESEDDHYQNQHYQHYHHYYRNN